MTPHRVALVCDFFYPRVGGVEGHLWALAQCLLQLGHHVVVITGSYWTPGAGGARTRRVGVRHMAGGLRVYYLPLLPALDQAVVPGYCASLPYVRSVLLREGVEVVHGHATSSVLAHETLLQAQLLGLRTVYTDHSLYGFADVVALSLARYLSLALACADAALAVSHVGRANLALRTGMPLERISVIPNAVDALRFLPAPCARPPPPRVNIVLLSRLVHRKGIDLAAAVIPAVCARFPHVHFLVGGDGPKRGVLEAMRDRCGLQERCELLGAIAHPHGVRALLVRGHIFLSCSLTEAFCIAVVEAACAGCLVVSTPVGGVPEVLPPDLMILAEAAHPAALVQALSEAVGRVTPETQGQGLGARGRRMGAVASGPEAQREGAATMPGAVPAVVARRGPRGVAARQREAAEKSEPEGCAPSRGGAASHPGPLLRGPACAGSLPNHAAPVEAPKHDPWAAHATVRAAYSWMEVARRTAALYDKVRTAPPLQPSQRFARWAALGPVMGPAVCVLMGLLTALLSLLEWLRPASEVDTLPRARGETQQPFRKGAIGGA